MPEIGLTDISELRHNGHMRSKPKRGILQIVRMQSLSMTDCAALRVLTINDSTFLSHISIPLLACYQIVAKVPAHPPERWLEGAVSAPLGHLSNG